MNKQLVAELYEFHEPHPTGGDCRVTITREKAIAHQRAHAKQTVKCDPYDNDIAALGDFIVNHWAFPACELFEIPKLEWEALSENHFVARTGFNSYYAAENEGEISWTCGIFGAESPAKSIEEAKAAAEADWQARMREALRKAE